MGGLGVEVLGLADGSVPALLEARIISPNSLMWAGDSGIGGGSISIEEANELVGRATDTLATGRPVLAPVEGGMDAAIAPLIPLNGRNVSCGIVGRGGSALGETVETAGFAVVQQ